MNRLTVPDVKTEKGTRRSFIDEPAVRKEAMTIYWALKEYEDLGLTPDQIKEVDRLYSEKCKEVAEYQKKIEDGRLIELPYKLGTNVYLLNTLGNKENWRVYKRKVSKFVYQQYRCKRIEVHFEEGRGYTLDGAFGDTVFLSRKEAEQALKRMKGE